MGVCTKERKGVTAAVLMAAPCTNSLGGESGGQKHEGCGGRSAHLRPTSMFWREPSLGAGNCLSSACGILWGAAPRNWHRDHGT